MDATAFVSELVSEHESILGRLAPAATLATESAGDLTPARRSR
jgi:hypothetical protein